MDISNLDEVVKKYLKNASVLLVDQNSSARVGLKKLLVSLGVPLINIYQTGSFEEAQEIIFQKRPLMVFCDFMIDGKSGLDLFQTQRDKFPKEMKQNLFILVTSNTSQSAVAQAAEEDIDAYILKPYTIEGFTLSLIRAVQNKVQPSDYVQLINQGKELLEEGKLDEAISLFASAMSKDKKPSLACFYEGLVFFKQNYTDNSEQCYQKGLGFSKIHYKCLIGLFDLLMYLKKYDLAYEVVQKIVRFFPANPKRLSTVLKLAIQTRHYSDIESLYQEFLKISNRNDALVKSICAAMIVCARHFFDIQEKETALKLVHNASITAAGNFIILKKAVELLSEYGELVEAENVLKRFTIQSESDPNYAVASFFIYRKKQGPEQAVLRGYELMRRGIKDIDVYRATIDSLKSSGKLEQAEELLVEARKAHPEIEEELLYAA